MPTAHHRSAPSPRHPSSSHPSHHPLATLAFPVARSLGATPPPPRSSVTAHHRSVPSRRQPSPHPSQHPLATLAIPFARSLGATPPPPRSCRGDLRGAPAAAVRPCGSLGATLSSPPLGTSCPSRAPAGAGRRSSASFTPRTRKTTPHPCHSLNTPRCTSPRVCRGQGLTLVPISAQLELRRPPSRPCNPT